MAISVHLMNEFNLDWPVWGGQHGRDRTRPADWELTEELVARVLAWADFFNTHYDWEDGWDACEHEREHRIEAQRLRRELQQELGQDHDVELRLWECAATPLIV